MSRSEWRLAATFIGAFALVELAVVVFLPAYHSLVWYAFYTAVSNFCIPWLPHEPAVMLYGKLYDPWLVAVVGGVATCWIEFFNYKLLTFFASFRRVQAFTSKQAYQKAEGYFRRFPFLSLVVSGFTPIPYAPFRVFAVTSRYPMGKYQLAVAVGRTPRYYLLALTGSVLPVPWWVYALILLAFLCLALWHRLRARPRTQEPPPLLPVEQKQVTR